MGRNINQLKQAYKGLNAYKQGAAGRLLYLSYPWIPCFEMTIKHKQIVPRIDYLLCYLRGDLFMGWWSKKGMEKIARFYFNKNLEQRNFINNLKNHWQNHDLAGVLTWVHRIEKIDLSKLTKAKLFSLFDEFGRVYIASWCEAIFLDSFDLMGEPLFEEIIKKYNIGLSPDDLHVLTSITELSSLQKEKKELLNLASSVKANRRLKLAIINKNNLLSLAQNWPIFFHRLRKHAQSYHWIYNDYAIIKRLDQKYFLNVIRNWLLKPNDFNREKKAIAAVVKLKTKRQRLMHKKSFPQQVAETIDLMVALSEWRDLRKMHCQIANSAVCLLATEFARRNNIPLIKIESLFWWELPKLFTSQKNKLVKVSNQRYSGAFFEGRLDTDPIHFGVAAEKLRTAADYAIQNKTGLVGRTAFPGQAIGRARIILTQDSFKKMRRGDILVAHNTRPEYVPIMKMAAAIVTEEGGITSHASIVARELKIPCLVGVQGVMSILKDGDRVEVDAAKGIVRLIPN